MSGLDSEGRTSSLVDSHLPCRYLASQCLVSPSSAPAWRFVVLIRLKVQQERYDEALDMLGHEKPFQANSGKVQSRCGFDYGTDVSGSSRIQQDSGPSQDDGIKVRLISPINGHCDHHDA